MAVRTEHGGYQPSYRTAISCGTLISDDVERRQPLFGSIARMGDFRKK